MYLKQRNMCSSNGVQKILNCLHCPLLISYVSIHHKDPADIQCVVIYWVRHKVRRSLYVFLISILVPCTRYECHSSKTFHKFSLHFFEIVHHTFSERSFQVTRSGQTWTTVFVFYTVVVTNNRNVGIILIQDWIKKPRWNLSTGRTRYDQKWKHKEIINMYEPGFGNACMWWSDRKRSWPIGLYNESRCI